MRPNFTFGPIDSLGQYLLYLSVVVFGIFLPLVIQKWIKLRQEKLLLAATRRALTEEITTNRLKVLKSRDSFAALATHLGDEISEYKAIWTIYAKDAPTRSAPDCPQPTESPIVYAAPIQTAWEIATIRQALPLLPAPILAAYARVYQLQLVLEQHRGNFVAITIRSNVLEAPTDLSRLPNIERRIEILLELQAMSRHQKGMAQSLVDAYDEALKRDA